MKPVASTTKVPASLDTKKRIAVIPVALYLCAFPRLPDKVVISYEQQVLQYREEIGLGSAVLYHTLQHVKHIPGISAGSQGLEHDIKQ